jgi:peptide/nickel transport system permease protein
VEEALRLMREVDHMLIEETNRGLLTVKQAGVAATASQETPSTTGTRSIAEVASHNIVLACAVAVLSCVVIMGVFAPLLAPRALDQFDLEHFQAPPVWAGGNWATPLGTDEIGRDILTLLMYGARTSVTIAVSAVLLGSVIGTLAGLLAGYFGGWIDAVVNRLAEAKLSLPVIVIALVVVLAFGPSMITLIAILAGSSWVSYARVVRAETLVLKESDFVALSVVAGAPWHRILYRDLVPNISSSVIVLGSLQFGSTILAEAGLSFLGIGIRPPEVSWGLMISMYRAYLTSDVWLLMAPSIMLAATALSANVLGDFLRDRLDVRLQRLE